MSDDDKRGAAFARTIWTLIIVTGVALALIRVMAVNLPWHLATARLALATGHWPEVNTFSYTFPDYPLYQQYPAFQAAMWAIFRVAGWAGLSAATAVGWVAAFLLIVRWAGPLRQGARFHVLWMLALWALQRRMVLRPDMFSMLAFGVELLALDAFARGRTRALALVPLAHLLWTNSHQLWPLSLVIQAMFVADLAWRRDLPPRAPGRAGVRGVGAADVRDAAGLPHRARAAAHGAVAGDLPRTRRRVPPHLDDVARARAGARHRRAGGLGAVAHAPQDAAFRMGAVAAVARAGRVGRARPDVLRRGQRRRVPALRAAGATRPGRCCCRPSAPSRAVSCASPV